jgi:hypothetical protein
MCKRAITKVVLVFAVSFWSSLIPTRAQTYTKLAPTDPIIHLENGQGSDRIYFSKTDAASLPIKVGVTDATGRINSVPASDIHAGSPISVDKNVFSLAVDVHTTQYVEPAAPYEATLLLFDKSDTVSPITVKIKIEDDAVVSFVITQTSIVAAMGDEASAHQRIRLRNDGKAAITVFEVTSSDLNDSVDGRRIHMNKTEVKTQLLPGQPMDLDFDLPQPVWAGSYTGTIVITANRSVDKSIGVTIQSRGPLGSKHLPLALFALVVLVGFAVSAVLDAWFGGGGLARAQAYISLRGSQDKLRQQLDKLNTWQSQVPAVNPPIAVPRTGLWIRQALEGIEQEWSNFNDRPVDGVVTDAQNFAALSTGAELFWSCIDAATAEYSGQPEVLRTFVSALDRVRAPESAADLARYKKDLTDAFSSGLPSVSKRAEVVLRVLGTKESLPKPSLVRDKIRGMAALYQVIVWCVVFVTAYQAFYAGHLLFGTLSDYMAVFLWSLGLTTTGTQIVSKVHKP